MDEVAPITQKIRTLKFQNKPWITKEIVNKMKMRDKIFYAAKNSGKAGDLLKYKNLRNEITMDLKNSKRKYYERNIDKNKYNSKQMWTKLKEIIGDKKVITAQLNNINFSGEMISDKKVIADKFNSFFVDSIEEIITDIDGNNHNINYKCPVYNNYDSKWTEFDEISTIEVNKIINGLDCNKGVNDTINTNLIIQI